ncbi:2Fe-2S iron-sulfur cluster-binding protein [Aquifex aeolicus]|uniref:NADH dehydrogenase I chain G n=1 Tax=Aquifex aeolicus (strain VF5) TaxID=224324 RepID=O66748_AQUAE|nr:2Fe-2S iron-sulfur cluster-binding protein [Aquifex aeolicus]7Q5Y_A Chain A, NADH dehydrogenase I chain G [Aquifex aeolicus VF5]7Q5Y_G Chain G, NADH dehydrogenase I chain G [Aquifex aeolicus VF5]7Q5Y_M Chain M, NADH dehydrogenase I chain G [Aquifex aeolicus VF5]7Q5Y_S Chain S, NADH dehydrogenase I chain G [Aquifex aeolicus VF5]AAC06711.1 NADH dehydrogenase I chain G [Aquifex aeolicus VF5]
MSEKVKIYIDDVEIEAEKGKTVLQVALENGIDIPYFCYHPRLSIAGACRMCVVYWEDINRLVISCNLPVQEGMRVRTHRTSEMVREQQKYLLQALMTRHPLDCPICDKAGECDLQNLGAIYGPQKQIVPISALEKEREEHDWESDFLEYYSNRCVVCYRCTRACDEVVGTRALYVEDRGFHSNIVPAVRPMDTSTCEMCGICVHVCPVGAIISKPFKYWSRSWLLEKGRTVCNLCPVGCEIQIEYGVGDWRSKRKVYRTKPTDELNICAKGFFGYDSINHKRLLKTKVGKREETPGNVVNLLTTILTEHGGKTGIVFSAYLPKEVIDEVLRIAKASQAYVTAPQSVDLFKFLDELEEYDFPTVKEFEKADAFVFIGDDITSVATVLSYYTKKKVYKIGKSVRDEKLQPEEITYEDLQNLEGNVFVLVTPHALNGEIKEVATKLKELKREKGFKVIPVPKDANALYLYEVLKGIYSDLPAVMEACERGDIENLIIFGEDILEFYEDKVFEELKEKLEHLVVVSPYEDGLSEYAHIKIPMSLMGENEGTYKTFFGEVKGKKFLPWAFDDLAFWKYLGENFKEEKGLKVVKSSSNLRRRFEPHLYRNNWITQRSQNLSRLYEKNKDITVYYERSV